MIKSTIKFLSKCPIQVSIVVSGKTRPLNGLEIGSKESVVYELVK